MVPSTNNSFRLLAAVMLVALMLLATSGRVAAETSLEQLDQLVSAGTLDEAVGLARTLDEQSDSSVDLTLPLARLAYALQQANDLQTSAEFYLRSVNASTEPAAETLAPEKIVFVRLAAGTILARTKRLSEAITALRPTLTPDSKANHRQRQMAVSICLKIGASALATGAATTASDAYSIALEHASEKQHPTAMLGDAWASAVNGTQPLEAAKKLAAFVDRYPQHADASRAARACAECLKQDGRPDDASVMLSDLLKRWPDSVASLEVVRSHRDLAVDLVPPSVRDWLMLKGNQHDVENLDAKTTMLGILVATQENELAAWANLAKHLVSIDLSGQTISDLLTIFSSGGKEGDAERLAMIVVAPMPDVAVSAGAREAGCRWAGRTQRWSMLALASELEDLKESSPTRTVAVETLFAEALMQTGRVEEAGRWWNYLVDTRDVDEFAMLLRCAEAETAVGKKASAAEQRIAAARTAAGDDRFNVSLVDLLDAQLAIRRLKFDVARSLLENVVRSSETDAGIRGRAQWLIGETHYLQQKFSQAIESYRRVEGIDPGGVWVSASLVQAGKSFEQLGRTREAAVCYGNLLSRFADTAHAQLARRRLAAIAPDTNPSDANSSKRTIRR